MASFVLVHGSGQNASCWAGVGGLLRERGHEVTAPDLPRRAPGLRLEDHAREIARAAPGSGSIVVAHSFSGAFLPHVPRFLDGAMLVFLAAVIPQPGRSVRDQLAEDPAMFSAEWIAAGPRWFDPAQQERLAEEFLFHDCDGEVRERALATLEVMDTRHLVTQPAPFERWPAVPAVSIVASLDRTLSPDWGRRISERELGRAALEIRAGHCPHTSRPAAVAELLDRLAGGTAA